MKKIMVPIDFSGPSYHAFSYAKAFANKTNASLTVVFVNQSKVKDAEVLASERQRLLERMERFTTSHPGTSDTGNLKLISVWGKDVAQTLVDLSSSFDLVILGSTGAGSINHRFLGSVAIKLATHAACSAILVPLEFNSFEFGKICFGLDPKNFERETVIELGKMATPLKAKVHFLKVKVAGEQQEKMLNYELLNTILNEEDHTFAFDVFSIKSDSVAQGLSDFVQTHEINICAIGSQDGMLLQRFYEAQNKVAKDIKIQTPIWVVRSK